MNSHAHLLFTGPHQSSVTVIPNLLVCLSYPILLLKPFPFSFPTILVIGCMHINPSMILGNHLSQHHHLMFPLLLSIHLTSPCDFLCTSQVETFAISSCVPCSFVVQATLLWWNYSSNSVYLVSMNSKVVISPRQPFLMPWLLKGRASHIPLLCVTLHFIIIFWTYFSFCLILSLSTYLLDICHVEYTVFYIFIFLALSTVLGIQ